MGVMEAAESRAPETVADRALCQQALASLPQPPRIDDWSRFEANLMYNVVTRFVDAETRDEATSRIEVDVMPSGVALPSAEHPDQAQGRILGDFSSVEAELPLHLRGKTVKSFVSDEPLGGDEYTVEWWMQRCQTYRDLADEVLSVIGGRWSAGGGRPSSPLVSREAVTIHTAHQGDIVHGYSYHRLLRLDWNWTTPVDAVGTPKGSSRPCYGMHPVGSWLPLQLLAPQADR